MSKKTTHEQPDFCSNQIFKKICIALNIKFSDCRPLLTSLGVSKSQHNSWTCSPRNSHYEVMPDQMLFDFLELLFNDKKNDALIRLICREIQQNQMPDFLITDALDVLIEKYRGKK